MQQEVCYEKKDKKQAADQGDATAQCNLGVMYGNGRGVEQDYTKAVYWYSKAAEQGNATAQVTLILLYILVLAQIIQN